MMPRFSTAGTIATKLRYSDFTTLTRQVKLDAPTHDEETIYKATQALLASLAAEAAGAVGGCCWTASFVAG